VREYQFRSFGEPELIENDGKLPDSAVMIPVYVNIMLDSTEYAYQINF
jgi:hypothetical protein